MSAQQGDVVVRRGLPVPASLIIAALIAVFGLSVAAQLMRESTREIRPVLNPADLATSGRAIRERHEALGKLDAVFAVNPADLATSGRAIRERHEALGKLDAVFAVNPADLATSGRAIRGRHEALGKLDAASITEEP